MILFSAFVSIRSMKFFLPILLLISSLASGAETNDIAITYEIMGRLGNNLIGYLHGKWVADQFGHPLLYKPFKYSNHFSFHESEKFLYRDHHSNYAKRVTLKKLETLSSLTPSTLVEVPFFRDEGPTAELKGNKYFDVPWESAEFRSWARALLKPRSALNTIQPPNDKLSVLIHVRTGDGIDSKKVQLKYFFKFPPKSFYTDSLKNISERFDNPPIYAYIMTDDTKPAKIAEEFRASLSDYPNIEFDFRKSGNKHDANVMVDFFSIPAFDCLIRGDSTFTIIASLLGDFKMIISPQEAHVENGEVVVDKVKTVIGP